MLPPKIPVGPPDQKKLLSLYRDLNAADRDTLLSFAAFLAQRAESTDGPSEPPAEPEVIPRPAQETVIAAMRRLTATYPMLEKDELLHEASGLMTAHVMQGRSAVEVIDELEVVFRRHYERVKSRP